MATYIMLMNWTEQGIQNVGDWPQRVASARSQIEAAGGKLAGAYVTMGVYDVVAVLSGIDDAGIAKLAMGLGKAGDVRTTTLRAFPEQEAAQIIQGL